MLPRSGKLQNYQESRLFKVIVIMSYMVLVSYKFFDSDAVDFSQLTCFQVVLPKCHKCDLLYDNYFLNHTYSHYAYC